MFKRIMITTAAALLSGCASSAPGPDKVCEPCVPKADKSCVPSVPKADNGLAPEVTDLNSADISYAKEKQIQYLKNAYISTKPVDKNDGLVVGELGVDGGDKDAVLKFVDAIINAPKDQNHNTDSLLISYKGKLIFESYFRRGRANYPHYQMSITKSYTAMALGHAMQMGYITMEDFNRPVVSFLKDIDQSNLAPGTKEITLHDAMHMQSGIRISSVDAKKAMKDRSKLKGQGQIQTYMELTAPVTKESKGQFKYQGSDPSMAVQVLETVVPGSAELFIKSEFFKKMGITNYGWQRDVSDLPKSAAGSSLMSRDMMKMGQLILNKGMWNGEQLIPEEFVEVATSKVYKSPNSSYGYFWWSHEPAINGKKYLCKSGRGAGGQFILMFPEIDLIVVTTSHNKKMGSMLSDAPNAIVPAFVK